MRSARKRPKYRFVTITFFVMLVGYFSYHALSGDRGLIALIQLTNRVEHLRNDYDIIHNKRMRLEHRVSLLNPDSLDLDMLEEQSKLLLGQAKPNEIIYSF